MRLAVFTNEFPTRVSTFFGRDMRGLIDAGIDLEVFPIYPVNHSLWGYVPDILNEKVLPRSKVHHLSFLAALRSTGKLPIGGGPSFRSDSLSITTASLKGGFEAFAKSTYVIPKALAWSQQFGHRYDHVLAYWGNYTATCAYLFHRRLPTKVPFTIFLHAGIDLFLNRVYLREKLLAATNIVTCSEFNRSFVKDHFPDIWTHLEPKIHVHYHGLDFTAFSYSADNRPDRKLLAVGRLDEWKGFEYLLQAMHELAKRDFECELELVGDGSERKNLERLAATLEISDRVKFVGWKKPEDIPAIMTRATVLVHPSGKLGDGVPNVIKEAMAVGTPVIGSAIAGIPELLGHGSFGVLVPPKDSVALANAIQDLLTDASARVRYGQLAKEHAVKHFDLWQNGRCLANFLRSRVV